MRRLILTILVLAGVAAAAFFAARRRKAELARAKPMNDSAVPVSVAAVREGKFNKTRKYVGVVEPLTNSNISSRITSEVTETPRTEGDRVAKGDLLLKLDDRHLKQAIVVAKARIESMKTKIASNNVNLKSSQASVKYWRKQLERDDRLFKRKIVSDRQLDATKENLNEAQGKLDVVAQNAKTLTAELAVLQGDLRLAETNLSYTELRAPYDCVVCVKNVYPGDLAAPGKVLMHVERTGALKTVFMVPQSDMKRAKLGDDLTIRFRNHETTAKITKIYPSVGSDKMIRMEARLSPNAGKGFVSGQYVTVILRLGAIEKTLIVPSGSINIDNNDSTVKNVFVLRSGRLRQIPVEIIADNQVDAAVKGDLKPGEEVVVSAFLGWAELADGVKAEVVGKENPNIETRNPK